MARANLRIALVAGITAVVATGVAAQNQQVYRYVDKDGRVVYSDRGPPSDARDVQSKRLRGNVIENNELPIAAHRQHSRPDAARDTAEVRDRCPEQLRAT